MELAAQVFGLGAMVCLFLIYQQKERKKLLICKLCADVFWVVHYTMLSAYGGMIPNFVGIFRELIFVNREKSRWANSFIVPCAFILINWILGIRTFNSPVNILPIAASTFVTVSLWCRNPNLTKIISIPVSSAFLVYDIVVGSYIGVINESLAIFSIIIYFFRRMKNE